MQKVTYEYMNGQIVARDRDGKVVRLFKVDDEFSLRIAELFNAKPELGASVAGLRLLDK